MENRNQETEACGHTIAGGQSKITWGKGIEHGLCPETGQTKRKTYRLLFNPAKRLSSGAKSWTLFFIAPPAVLLSLTPPSKVLTLPVLGLSSTRNEGSIGPF